ncbi:MAG: tetratricopeptide repeat protein [Gammaproteobacteria bacterium]|jgi:tetratricopeptide (TPR) repeat protein
MRKQRLARRSAVCVGFISLAVVALAHGQWAESYQYESQGDYAAAILAIAPIVEADPDHEFAVLRTAWLKYLLGDHNAAIRDYQRALEINDQSLEARLGLTLPLLAQRRWREAAAVSQEVLAAAPWNYYAHIRLLVAEEGQRQWQTLARHAATVAAHYPGDATALIYLARAQARQGNPEAARVAYQQVLERIPGHQEAAAFLAQSGG